MERQHVFCEDLEWQVGLELEGWLLDKDLQPQAIVPKMLTELDCSELSEEMSKEIFEINLKHLAVKANFLELFDKNFSLFSASTVYFILLKFTNNNKKTYE